MLRRTPKHDIVLDIGDLNAKVGNDNIGKETCMVANVIGQLDENGKCILDLCEMNGLVVGKTIFA